MTENAVFYTDPKKIKVRDSLPRLRKDLRKINELLVSIKNFGQIEPVVVTRDMELIAGGRRLAACLLGNIEVMTIYKDVVDDLRMRELELEENLQREDLTPAEEVQGVEELHKLKQSIHGESQSGKSGGWKLDDTAELIGKTRGSVIEDLKLAEALKRFPDLATMKTKSDIKKAVKIMEKVQQRSTAMETYNKTVVSMSDKVKIIHEDIRKFMPTMETGSIDILLTDPLYGMNADQVLTSVGGLTGGPINTSGLICKDDTKQALEVLQFIAQESFRVCSAKAHGYIFVCPEWFHVVREMFVSAGWLAYIKPMIWIKRGSGQCNNPSMWPASGYEMILYVRRVDSVLVTEGRVDWIQCDPVTPSQRVHPYEKPIPLLKDLLMRSALPGYKVFDPCMGSGATLEAALDMKLVAIGCDIDEEAYKATSERIHKWSEKQNVKI